MKKKKSLPEIYDSLDMPVYNWMRVHETSDLSWLMKVREKVTVKSILSLLEKAWEKIYSEYIEEFGLPESFISIKEKELQIAIMKCEQIATGNRTLNTFINIEEQILSAMRKEVGKANFMESKIAIEAKYKFQINMRGTTVREFYSYLKHLK